MQDHLDSTQPERTTRSGSSPSASKGWQPPTIEELQALLPQYKITKLLGRGGMGAVYQGTQVNLDRPVAIKILPPGMDDDDGANFTERFKNEARAMAKLSHPGIIAVYDFGETSDGILYIVMEFIAGTDVQKMVLEQGRMHSAHAMAVTAHVCDALQYAHDRKIIHRDIKPANIMVGYDGVVKVADFGLAKMSKAGESALTRSGMTMGTLHYMAPEALMLGSSVDHRADIYAVGVMLYYMLTGKLPQGMFELPSLQVPGLDPRYDGIIAKALRDDREIRYQSVAELRKDLDGILTQPVIKVKPSVEAAPAALPATVRPQHHGTPPGPAHRVEVRVERTSSPLLWAAVILLGGIVVWTQLKKPQPEVPAQIASKNEPATGGIPPPGSATPAAAEAATSSTDTAPAPVPVSAPPPGVWQQLLVEDLRRTLDFTGSQYTDLVREPGGDPLRPHYRAKKTVTALIKSTLRNGSIRAHFGSGWAKFPPYLMMRHQAPGRFISANVFEKTVNLRRVFHQPDGNTTYFDFGRKNFTNIVIEPQQAYDIELKAEGSRFTFFIDGKEMLAADDSTYNFGRAGIFMQAGDVIESLEYMILPMDADQLNPVRPATLPAAAASPKTGTTTPAVTADQKVLEKQYLAAIEQQVTPAVASYALAIQGSYAAALERALKAAPGTSPADLAALKEEMRRLALNKSVPDTDEPATPAVLKGLRDTYRKAVDAFRAQKIAPVKAIYDQQLKALKSADSPAPATVALTKKTTTAAPGKDFTNSLGMKFVPVPDTRVLFCIHETRRKDYATYAAQSQGISMNWSNLVRDGIPVGREDDHPVIGVNWNEARAFCEWLSRKEGITCRLPTDHEWSCAIGIGKSEGRMKNDSPRTLSQMGLDDYPWRGGFPPSKPVGNLAGEECSVLRNQGVIEGYKDGFVTTSPVMSFPANGLGLFDLEGNAYEWCEDLADENSTLRVLRGGAWSSNLPDSIRSAARSMMLPSIQGPALGFRVVVETTP